jgi:F-type H+-transporting ATPase subunit b
LDILARFVPLPTYASFFARTLTRVALDNQIIREPYRDWANSHIDRIRSVLEGARAEHTQAVRDRISSVEQMKEVVDITKALFAISKVCF